MRKLSMLSALAMLLAGAACAQDISGDWQGDLPDGARQFRVVFRIAKTDSGAWMATMYSIDQSSGDPIPVNSVTLIHADFKLSLDAQNLTYRGKLSPDAALIKGAATRFNRSFPLELRRATRETAYRFTPFDHRVQFINVDTNVNLEVLDWGGSGRPLILLAGYGDTAHRFDTFAPKLTASWHVYGITRRGFGASSHPDSGYSADRLGDDVLAVIDSLKLNRPVLAGHSIAGEELSSVGSRYPERVAGLIYLEAGYPYAFTPPTATLPPASRGPMSDPVLQAIMAGQRKYTKIDVPILAFYALPNGDSGPPRGPADIAAARAAQEALADQAKAFEAGLPSARVVRIPYASHYIFYSHEADVLREMNAFLSSLPLRP